MLDIGNNQGKARKCICGCPEELEHIMLCKQVRESYSETTDGRNVTKDDKRSLKEVMKWMKGYLDWRKGYEEKQ